MIAKTAIANGAAIENAAEFPGNDTSETRRHHRYSGHPHMLVFCSLGAKEIARNASVVGNQNFQYR